jgi:hypothetical protein
MSETMMEVLLGGEEKDATDATRHAWLTRVCDDTIILLRFRPDDPSLDSDAVHTSRTLFKDQHPYSTHFLSRSRAVMVTNSTTRNLPSFNFPSPLFSLLISSSESHRASWNRNVRDSAVATFRFIRFARLPWSKLYKSTDSFVYAQTSLMSFEALKQYFRSRHGKTSYTEEPSTLFFF